MAEEDPGRQSISSESFSDPIAAATGGLLEALEAEPESPSTVGSGWFKPQAPDSIPPSDELLESITSIDNPSSACDSAKTGGVHCAVCPKRAFKSCLTCAASFCEDHVKHHYSAPALQRHRLVDATEDLQQRLCPRHHRELELYCTTDQTSLCALCVAKEHIGHNIVLGEHQGLQMDDSEMENKTAVPPPGPIEFTSVKPDSVCLCWGRPEGLTGPHTFRVSWTGEGSEGHLDVQDLKLHVQKLTPGEQYTFTVATLSDDDRESRCASATVCTEIPTPECVNVNMDLVSASVTWSKPEGVTQASYTVTLHGDGECLQTISTRSLQHRFSKLEIGREYAVTVCTRLKKRSSKFISKTIRTDSPYIRRNSRDVPPNLEGGSPGPVPELRLVLLGVTGDEKRAVGNAILGTTASTEIQHSESRQGEVAGRRLTLVETPNWFLSGLSEKDMRQDVGLCVSLSAPGPHAFLLVISTRPAEEEERTMLEKIEDIFGESCWGHTMLLFTHAEGLRAGSVEKLLQTGSQQLQQLAEKCGNRCHLLNVMDRPYGSQITLLLEKIEVMVSGNQDKFYSSDTYQEAQRQLREIERRIQKEQEMVQRKLRDERERREELEKLMEESLEKMQGEIQHHEGELKRIYTKTTMLERTMKEERNEEKKKQMERELNENITLRKETEKKLKRVREKREREMQEMEKRHKEEMEEMRESYKREAKVEAEQSLMKIILPELQRNISITKQKMDGEFKRQIEERNRRIEEKEKQVEGLLETVKKLSHLVEEADKRYSELMKRIEEKERLSKSEPRFWV